VIAAGLGALEITMNTEDAPAKIRRMVRVASKKLAVGAGTVLSMDALHKALEAGATFIVSPVFIPEIVDYCKYRSIPVFPGALSPQEIYHAWSGGASMVKVFPSKTVGPAYFSEIKGPFNDIELLACGGVTPENMHTFLDGGASAIAFGGSVFDVEEMKAGTYENIQEKIKLLIASFNDYALRGV